MYTPLYTFPLSSLADTSRAAGLLAGEIVKLPFCTIGLKGPLGAGKTTLTRELLRCCNVKEEVASPTFVLCYEYPLIDKRVIEHWDLYRLPSMPPELSEQPRNGVMRIIEWADKFSGVWDTLDVRVLITVDEDSEGGAFSRSITIERAT